MGSRRHVAFQSIRYVSKRLQLRPLGLTVFAPTRSHIVSLIARDDAVTVLAKTDASIRTRTVYVELTGDRADPPSFQGMQLNAASVLAKEYELGLPLYVIDGRMPSAVKRLPSPNFQRQ